MWYGSIYITIYPIHHCSYILTNSHYDCATAKKPLISLTIYLKDTPIPPQHPPPLQVPPAPTLGFYLCHQLIIPLIALPPSGEVLYFLLFWLFFCIDCSATIRYNTSIYFPIVLYMNHAVLPAPKACFKT